MATVRATAVPPDDGEDLSYGGWEAVIKLAADATGGAMTIIESRHDAGRGASPHVHSLESETFIMLEGSATFRLGEERVELGPGGIAFGPPGTIHGFVVGPDGARLLHLFAPSGMEDFFRALHVPHASARDLVEIRRRHGIESVSD